MQFSKHTRNLSPASRAILLSGLVELYQQMLARALAHSFESKLLLLDFNDFSIKLQNKFGCSRKVPSMKRSISEATTEQMSSWFCSFSMFSSTQEKQEVQNNLFAQLLVCLSGGKPRRFWKTNDRRTPSPKSFSSLMRSSMVMRSST